jgi:FAD:protein FMN transferase
MHTRVDILFPGTESEDFYLAVATEVADRISEIESIGNCFNPQSELGRFNKSGLEQSALSPELRRILALCDEWKHRTGGLFDVACSGEINLSGFLKGYALDAVRPILEHHGITSALVNLGNSSVLALGNQSASADGWTVKRTDGREYCLHNQCLTTSGNTKENPVHIFNPIKREYVLGEGIVSVVTDGGAEGEVMSTVSFINSSGIL